MSSELDVRVEPGLTLDDTVIVPRGAVETLVAPTVPRPSQDPPVVYDAISQAIRCWRRHAGDPDRLPSTRDGRPDIDAGAWTHALPDFSVPHQALTRTFTATDHHALHADLEPVALQHATWDNLTGPDEGHYTSSLSETVTDSTTIGWSKSQAETRGIAVKVGVSFAGVGSDASANYSVSTSVGQSASHTKQVAVGQSSGLTYTLKPGEAAVAVLLLERGVLSGTVTYRVEWGGTLHWGYYNLGAVIPPGRRGWPYPTVAGGTVTAAELAPWLPATTQVMEIGTDFSGEEFTKVVSVPATDAFHVEAAINRAVAALRQAPQGAAAAPAIL